MISKYPVKINIVFNYTTSKPLIEKIAVLKNLNGGSYENENLQCNDNF